MLSRFGPRRETCRVGETAATPSTRCHSAQVFYVDLISAGMHDNDEIEETQLIDLKNEDNRTAEVTIIDDDEPGVIAFPGAFKEGSPAKALPPVTCSEKAGHARIRVGRFNGANGEVHVDCKFIDKTAVNGKHYKAQNHPITFHNTEVEKFLEVELLYTGLEDGVEFTVVLENVRSDHKERQPSLGHHTSAIVHSSRCR